MARLLQVFFPPKIEEVEYIPLPEIKMKTNAEKFIEVCLNALDTEVTPQDNIPDYVACAEVISTLIKKVFPDFPMISSTKDLDMKLFMDKRFQRITEPERGVVVISPRTINVNGHVGTFITSEKIASNTSKDGIFRGNYLWNEWIREFKDRRGLKIYLYKLL